MEYLYDPLQCREAVTQMEVSQPDILKIVEQASTIAERLSDRFISDATQVNHQLINSRLKRWCQVVAQGNPEKFAKRLAWNELDVDKVRQVLDTVRLTNAQQIPAWAETIREALQADSETVDAGEYRYLNPEEPIPFEDVYLPFVEVARQKLIAQTGDSYQLLSENAHTSLERSLLWRLASICGQSLALEFSTVQLLKQSSLRRLLSQLQSNGANEQYQDFVKGLTTGGLLSFFQQYSVLARLVGTAIDFWVEATAEFLQRLVSDLPTIQQTFQAQTGHVVAIQSRLSDPHNGGRSVIALTFASGLKLIYKPKDLGLEVAYFQILAWCNQQEVLLPFKLLKVINCKTHGWVECVEHLPCENEAAAQRYYQRAGMLLCLLYVLSGTDCHYENLIASGEHPVLVDIETLLHPHVREINGQEDAVGAQFLANEQFADSVLRTGLLPRWKFGADNRVAYDVSGLGGVGKQDIPIQIPKWQHINTDNISLGYESGTISIKANAASLNGITLSPNDYVNEIVAGFQQMYQFLMERREALLMTDSPLTDLCHQRVRFVLRDTQIYGHILREALNPKFLRNGVDRSIELDVLSRAFLTVGTKPHTWSLQAVEIQAMEQMDVPYFAADSDSDALRVNPKLIIEECFTEPSYERAIARLRQLSDVDLAQQITIIRGSLYSQVARTLDSTTSTERAELILNQDAIALLTPAQMVQQAVEIAQELQQQAIHAADGSATWIGMEYIPAAQRLQLQPLGYGLYDGACGVALFLAALEKITGETGFQNLALGALQSLRETLQEKDQSPYFKIIQRIGIGGATGVGSIIYSLVRISQFLDKPDLLDSARLAASLITQKNIASDRQFDVMAGSAGAVLGLLCLYQATADSSVLEQAVACGYHLLDNRVASNSGPRAWVTAEDKLLAGFSHGAAGIAYALLRLHETTQNPVFLEAAVEAIAYERSVFSPTAGNWPDLRSLGISEGELPCMTTWCHGAPGIGLARLGGLKMLDTAEVRQEIAVALNTTQKFGLRDIDHLCCGNFGRTELLLVAAQKLSHSDLWKTAQTQAAQVVAKVKHAGSFCLFPKVAANVYNPGFFQGTAGIGYELLRLAYPNSLPSVMLWE